MSQNHGAANILGCHPSLAEIINSLATYLLKKGKVRFFLDIAWFYLRDTKCYLLQCFMMM